MSFRILVVDDSHIVRTMVRKAIAMSGAEVGAVHEAANGRDALAVLAASPVDVVFTDVNMPEMGGVELVERMRADAGLAAIPVIVVSSERNEALAGALRGKGVHAYVTKPFRPESFRELLRGLAPGGSHG
jgi:two-component system, chemotaxis family, chemotaxis protein CheY